MSYARVSGRELGIFFGRNSDGLCERLQKIAVVVETGFFTGLPHGISIRQQNLGDGDALGGDIFVDGGAGIGLKDAADIGRTQIKMGGQFL